MPTGGEVLTLAEAAAVIVAHNHPNGALEPSPSDIEITGQRKAAGAIVGIDLLDHIIFNRTGYFSFLEEGALSLWGSLAPRGQRGRVQRAAGP
jgi:DNA repair protein RadC